MCRPDSWHQYLGFSFRLFPVLLAVMAKTKERQENLLLLDLGQQPANYCSTTTIGRKSPLNVLHLVKGKGSVLGSSKIARHTHLLCRTKLYVTHSATKCRAFKGRILPIVVTHLSLKYLDTLGLCVPSAHTNLSPTFTKNSPSALGHHLFSRFDTF